MMVLNSGMNKNAGRQKVIVQDSGMNWDTERAEGDGAGLRDG